MRDEFLRASPHTFIAHSIYFIQLTAHDMAAARVEML